MIKFGLNRHMRIQLTKFETDLLNRVIPTQTLSDSKSTQISLRNFIADDKENIMAAQQLNEAEYKQLQVQSVKNIFQFLRENDFVGEREGGVNFLTEKGKHLRKQGSIENYELWRNQVRAENKVIINTIETRGYLDQDQINRNRRILLMHRIRKFVLYPILVIIVLVIALSAAHYYGIDAKVPFISHMFDKTYVKQKKDNAANEEDEKEDKEQDAKAK